MKKTVKKNIAEMKSLVKNMPKTINEMLSFEGDDAELEGYEDEEMPEGGSLDEPEAEDEPDQITASEHAAQLIDDIRKKALRAMADLADTPEDENYVMLKKVWQMTDRKPEQQQQQQNGQAQALGAAVQKAVNESIFDFFKKKDKKDKNKSDYEESDYEKERQAEMDKRARQANWEKEQERNRKYGSSDPFSSKISGWKSDGLYHDSVGVKDSSDQSKDWMYGDR
jgi:hypothetical protein